jgi:hypothetical protein
MPIESASICFLPPRYRYSRPFVSIRGSFFFGVIILLLSRLPWPNLALSYGSLCAANARTRSAHKAEEATDWK